MDANTPTLKLNLIPTAQGLVYLSTSLCSKNRPWSNTISVWNVSLEERFNQKAQELSFLRYEVHVKQDVFISNSEMDPRENHFKSLLKFSYIKD